VFVSAHARARACVCAPARAIGCVCARAGICGRVCPSFRPSVCPSVLGEPNTPRRTVLRRHSYGRDSRFRPSRRQTQVPLSYAGVELWRAARPPSDHADGSADGDRWRADHAVGIADMLPALPAWAWLIGYLAVVETLITVWIGVK
jgi:hypothetical protein